MSQGTGRGTEIDYFRRILSFPSGCSCFQTRSNDGVKGFFKERSGFHTPKLYVTFTLTGPASRVENSRRLQFPGFDLPDLRSAVVAMDALRVPSGIQIR